MIIYIIKIAPCGPSGNGYKVGYHWSSEYTAVLDRVIGGYSGSSNITDPAMRNLNYDYCVTKNYLSTSKNMQTVAYMLDRERWTTKFTGDANGNSQIDYVIAGPSIELLFKSYNAKYETNYKAKATSNEGYSVSIGGDADGDYVSFELSEKLNVTDRTYVTTGTSMWLASPADYLDSTVWYVQSIRKSVIVSLL